MKLRPLTFVSLTVGILVFFSACTKSVGVTPTPINTGSAADPNQPSFSQFQDIPIPPGARMNMNRTLILGTLESWIGRLVLETNLKSAHVFDFFKQRTPEFGWQEVTAVRAATSVLTYTRSNRVLTILITSRTLLGSEAVLTVSPRGPSIGSSMAPTNPQLPLNGITPGSPTSLPLPAASK